MGTIAGWFHSLVLASDGATAASVQFAGEDDTLNILLWDTSDLRRPVLRKLHTVSSPRMSYPTIAPDLASFVVVYYPADPHTETRAIVRDMATGRVLWEFEYTSVQKVDYISARFIGLKTLVVDEIGNQGIFRQFIFAHEGAPPKIMDPNNFRWITADEKWMMTPSPRGPAIWNVETMEEVVNLPGHLVTQGAEPYFTNGDIEFSPAGNLIAVGGIEQTRNEFNLQDWIPAKLNPFPRKSHSNSLSIWDVKNHREVHACQNGQTRRFSPDGSMLAVFQQDQTVKLWRIPPDRPWGRIILMAWFFWCVVAMAGWGALAILGWTGNQVMRTSPPISCQQPGNVSHLAPM